MKKLLVVMLVLAVAGMANAAMELSGPSTVAVGESITIDIVAPVLIAQGWFYIGVNADSIGDASFDLTDAIIAYVGSANTLYLSSAYSGDLGVRDNYLEGYFTDTTVETPPGTLDPVVGTLATGIDLTGVTAGLLTISLYDGDLGLYSTFDVEVTGVPEPITIGLLGLGGLFLRRRR